jgi:hypothetical protein
LSTSKLPARPSLESLRKQARKLARDIVGGNTDAIDRARAQMPRAELPLSRRDAQLVLAREYGFPGWKDLVKEVEQRLGRGLEWAVSESRRVIHVNDTESLRQLLTEFPALLSWKADENDGGLLGMAAGSYSDSFDPISEEHFTRAACAELLIDAGAVVMPRVCEELLQSHARGLLQLFRRKGLLPPTLKFLAALGDIGGVREALDDGSNNVAAFTEAFSVACGFKYEAIASLLLDRALALDPDLGAHVDASLGRPGFVKYFIENRPPHATEAGLWKAFVMEQAGRTVSSHSGHETSVAAPGGDSDLAAFLRLLHSEPWLLDEAFVEFQIGIIERATLKDRKDFITALLDLDPAILKRQPPPPSQAIEFAFTYVRTHLIPLLIRIWALPDDLPHAAGMGDLPRVKRWFDASGAPALGEAGNHYPCSAYMPKGRVEEYERQWSTQSVQRVLDTALAWAVLNNHLDVADFLLARGADINTTWSSHEPASILHELVFHANYQAMQFLIDRGIDMTIRDYRWNATAQGWAFHAAKDEKMARWLADAQQRREQILGVRPGHP